MHCFLYYSLQGRCQNYKWCVCLIFKSLEKNISKCDQKTNGRNKRKYVPYTQTHTSFNHIMKISYGTGEEAIQPEEGVKIIKRGWALFSGYLHIINVK